MEDTLSAAELLAEREEALAALYRTYSWRFTDYRMLWNDLRADELIHAGWARSLAGALDGVDEASLVEFEYRLKIQYLIVDQATGEKLTKAYSIQIAVDLANGETCFAAPQVLCDKINILLASTT